MSWLSWQLYYFTKKIGKIDSVQAVKLINLKGQGIKATGNGNRLQCTKT